jgi:hypothetical protein
MMGEDNGTRWQSLPPFLMLLLLAVGSFWWIPWPLQGERPPQSAVGIQVEGVQQAAGRLWQDPFAVVQRYREGGPSVQAKGRDLSWLAGVAAEKCTEKTPCRLLGVMVFGSPYVGGEEWRRNKRYAVLAGLSRHGFIPEDTEHIGFVEQESGLPPVLPFEWLQREGTDEKKERVLLLWLDEDALTRELYDPTSGGLHSAILPRLQQLLEPLNVPGMQGLDILGPSSSGTLSKLASELKTAPQEQEPSGGEVPLLRSAHWYSASATSDKAWKETTGKPGPLPITRVIAKDSKLAEMLVQELKRRGLKSQDTVALVGQLDTAYSRNLINLLHKGLEENFRPPERIQVITVHYLRGIDGEKPGDGKGSDRNGDKKKTGNAESREEQVERPEGDSQIDYLRRLTVELARQHQAFKPSGEIRAVGVLGNDYHDKLLVLRALRHAFPDAIFFTTDLEASMLHPIDNRSTRNLVVASAFGLELEPALQAGFAPFRSSYQTATYLATRLSLALESPGAGPPKLSQKEIDERISPLLFEIGRSVPVRLSNPPSPSTDEAGTCDPQRSDWLDCKDWQPATDTGPVKRTLLGSALTLAAGIALAAVLSAGFRRLLLGHWRLLAATVVMATVVTTWLIASLPAPLGEPFSWVEGVSAWPTEILRLLTLALSAFFFLRGIRRLRRCDQETQRRLFHAVAQDGADEGGDDDPCAPLPATGSGRVPRRDIWRLYRARQHCVDELTRRLANRQTAVAPSWRKRHFVLQSLGPALLFLLVGVGLTLALGSPHTPARGEAMLALDRIVLFATVASFLMLLFFSLNASKRAIWLAKSLTTQPSWPSATLARLGWRKGLSSDYFGEFLDVQLLADTTAGVQGLVYYPFVILFLLVVSRTSLFDGWHIPLSLYLIFAVSGILMLAAAIRLRKAAEETRAHALEDMRLCLLKISGRCPEEVETETMEKQIEGMIPLVKGIRKGAYSPIGEQPIVRAILGLASGVYAVSILDWVNLAGL